MLRAKADQDRRQAKRDAVNAQVARSLAEAADPRRGRDACEGWSQTAAISTWRATGA